jgi:hypothetical protein
MAALTSGRLDAFYIFSPKLLHAKSQDLPEIFLWEVLVLFGTILDSRRLPWFMIC